MSSIFEGDMIKSISVLAVLFALIIAISYIQPASSPTQDTEELKKFVSEDELKSYLKTNENSGYSYYSMNALGGSIEVMRNSDSSVPTASSQNEKSSSSSGDYSHTNVQVEGVDEADFVKNDGNYIYEITGNNITIISAVPAEEIRIASTISLVNKSPSQIFINGDRLTVFGNEYYNYRTPVSGIAEKVVSDVIGISYPYYYASNTFIDVYDITDRANPVLISNQSSDGSYYNSRMIGNYVYLITTQYINDYENPVIPEAAYRCSGIEGRCFNMWYFDYPDNSRQFTIVSAFDVNNPSEISSKVFLTGYASNLYVSENNIYVVHTKTLSIYDFLERYANAISSALPEEVNSRISRIISSDLFSNDEKYSAIERTVSNYTYSLGDVERKNLMNVMEEKISAFYNETAKEMEKTVVHKISVSGLAIEYKNSGEVPGTTLNQFSMDEYLGNLRIATTTNNWQTTSKNHLYILDSDLNQMGSIEDMAPGERIYSVRFMGERGYIVTFRQVDPLFAIDLSNPSSPSILGQLKINGVSDYLHPYDDTHIIGVGRDANESGQIKGMKLSLFDVSDPANPVEISKYMIGKRGTYSDALYEHRAFLFSKDRNLLVIPVSVAENEDYYTNWQGAYVFNVDLENGFSLKGKVTHTNQSQQDGEKRYYYYDYNSAISRSLYIGDVLYTISQSMVKANSLGDLSELGKVQTAYENPIIYYDYLPESPVSSSGAGIE